MNGELLALQALGETQSMLCNFPLGEGQFNDLEFNNAGHGVLTFN